MQSERLASTKRKAGRIICTRFECFVLKYQLSDSCLHSSPDSDDTLPGDESEEFGRDDTFLVNANSENKFYGTERYNFSLLL